MSLNCPLCNKEAMPRWKKIFMSPLGAVPCQSCDCDIKVSWRSYLMAISVGSLVFLLAYLKFEEGSLDQYLVYGGGFVLMLLGQVFFMPVTGETVVQSEE